MDKDKIFSSILKGCGYLLIALSLLVIYGWFNDISLFKSVLPDLPTMKFNTAAVFCLLGFSLLLREKNPFASKLFAIAVIGIGIASSFQDLFALNFGIDELLIRDLDGKAAGLAHPGRMAVTTAICFISAGIALLLSYTTNKKIQLFNQFCWHFITLISVLAFVGYAYEVPVFYRLSFLSSMAMHTALLFFLVSIAGSLIHYNIGITGLLNGKRAGNMAARKLIPSMVILVLLLGYLRIIAHSEHLVSVEMGIALLSTSFLIISIIFVAIAAKQLNQVDEKRDQAENALKEVNLLMERKIEDRTHELKELEEQFEYATSQTNIGIGILNVATNKVNINSYFSEYLLGIAGNRIIERGLSSKILHPDEVARHLEISQRALRTGEPYEIEVRAIRHDGADRILKLNGMVKCDEKGNPHRGILIFRDITEEKAVREEILKISQTLKAATEGSKIGIWEWDISSNELKWDNGMHVLYGLSASEFSGAYDAWENGVHPEDQKYATEQLQKAIRGEGDFDTEFRVVWPNGSIHFIKGNGIVQRDTEGKPLRMVGTNWDITSIKENEKQLLEKTEELGMKNKELEQFAFIASHDLQEPLRTITSLLQIIETNHSEKFDDLSKQSFAYINEAAQRMKELIRDLLEYSKVGRNSELKEVNTDELVQLVIKDLSKAITESGAQIKTVALPKIKAYETEMRSLFQNLLSNAIKYRKPNSTIEVSITAEEQKDFWQFTIADNGIGIDPTYKEKIFEIFQRLHRKNEYEGTGIGLAQCKKIIDLHKGEIWIDSEAGKGSVFYFTINKNLHEKN